VVLTYAFPSLKEFGLNFFTSANWDPPKNQYSALTFIHGTFVSSIIALILAIPVSLGIAIFLSEILPFWLSKPIRFLIELLAAIPSVIYGLFAYVYLGDFLFKYVQPYLIKTLGFIPFFSEPEQASYFSIFHAGVILAIMIIPIISSLSIELLKNVPKQLREASLALGATRWEMIKISCLKTAGVGIIGALIIAFGRALGETMAVTMVIGGNRTINWSIFDPGASITSAIANEFEEADDLRMSAIFSLALTLFIITLIVNIFARWYVMRASKKLQGK
jgi:phosphate transport system permease protein